MPSPGRARIFAACPRLSRPRGGQRRETDIAELRRQYAYLSDRFGAPPRDATFEPAQIGPLKGEWVRCRQLARRTG